MQTARLILRACCPADASDFAALERDVEVMRYLNGGQPVNRSLAAADSPFLMPDGTEPYVWAAHRRAGGAFVGWFCLWPQGDKVADLGYRLRRADWGQGLASEGALALVAHGFGACGYDRIFAGKMAVNLRSRRVMEKIGMTHARTVFPDHADPIAGYEAGEVEYDVTRAVWADRGGT